MSEGMSVGRISYMWGLEILMLVGFIIKDTCLYDERLVKRV